MKTRIVIAVLADLFFGVVDASADILAFDDGTIVSNAAIVAVRPATVAVRLPSGASKTYWIDDLTLQSAAALAITNSPYKLAATQAETIGKLQPIVSGYQRELEKITAKFEKEAKEALEHLKETLDQLDELDKAVQGVETMLALYRSAYKDLAKQVKQYATAEKEKGRMTEQQTDEIVRMTESCFAEVKKHIQEKRELLKNDPKP
ncbi:MAG: hypothetical protein LBW77_00940 [Verrucomicrobiota bacterium]|jgi:methyl-accepting chemotaxis protein|nr:hypothetical protein [Verrucomicrobiota bacterium]